MERLCLEFKSKQFHGGVARIGQLFLLTRSEPSGLSDLQVDPGLALLQFGWSERNQQRRFSSGCRLIHGLVRGDHKAGDTDLFVFKLDLAKVFGGTDRLAMVLTPQRILIERFGLELNAKELACCFAWVL